MKKTSLLLCISFLLCNILSARHLYGGYLDVEVIPRTDDIRLKLDLVVHRDCTCIDCAPFDDNAVVAIYLIDSNTNLDELSRASFFDQYIISLKVVRNIDADFDADQICLEEGKYSTERSLPKLIRPDQFYYIVYQRCCRTDAVSNLIEVNETGITISRVINYESTLVENKAVMTSSTFSPFVEVGEAFELSTPFINLEAQDSIAYQLCAPLTGGGPFGASDFPGDPNSCIGVAPNPPCPTLNDTVQYQEGLSAQQPVILPSFLKLDTSTGTISGQINQLGVFQIGVCALKYRNGMFLSKTLFDLPIITLQRTVSSKAEFTVQKLKISPNPSNGLFHIKGMTLNDKHFIKLIDLYGQSVDFNIQSSSEDEMLIEVHPKGVFFLLWNDENRVESQKIIVQ